MVQVPLCGHQGSLLMVTIVIGNNMGSLTTPTIGSTFSQSSRYDFSFVIVGYQVENGGPEYSAWLRKQGFVFHILNGFTFSCNSSCILRSSITWCTWGMQGFSFCSPLIFANWVCFFEATGTEHNFINSTAVIDPL